MWCCHQFVHKTCAEQWNSNHERCGLCLGSRTNTAIVPGPVGAVHNREILTRQRVLDRLRGLLNSDELQQQLDQVSCCFVTLLFYFLLYFFFVAFFSALKKCFLFSVH